MELRIGKLISEIVNFIGDLLNTAAPTTETLGTDQIYIPNYTRQQIKEAARRINTVGPAEWGRTSYPNHVKVDIHESRQCDLCGK